MSIQDIDLKNKNGELANWQAIRLIVLLHTYNVIYMSIYFFSIFFFKINNLNWHFCFVNSCQFMSIHVNSKLTRLIWVKKKK